MDRRRADREKAGRGDAKRLKFPQAALTATLMQSKGEGRITTNIVALHAQPRPGGQDAVSEISSRGMLECLF